jgi:FkbM family methyltransferase
MIKKLIYDSIEKIGFMLLKKGYMPNGISLSRDVSKDYPLNKVRVVFDVGASVGAMSTYFAKEFPDAKVYAFEPIESTFKKLSHNVANNKRILPHHFGFSEKDSKEKVFLQADHGLNSINQKINIPDAKNQNAFEWIEIKRIDDFCKEQGITQIDFLKTDAEGMDLHILKGAENMIASGKVKYVLSEVGFHKDNERNTPFDDLKAFLFQHNFKLKAFYDQSDYGNKPYITCANALFKLQE